MKKKSKKYEMPPEPEKKELLGKRRNKTVFLPRISEDANSFICNELGRPHRHFTCRNATVG